MAWLRPNTFVPQHGIAAEEMNSLSNLGTSINFVRIRDDLPAISRDGTLKLAVGERGFGFRPERISYSLNIS